jgi:GTPase SAR1 family protein
LSIKENALTLILGDSGSGKTSLCNKLFKENQKKLAAIKSAGLAFSFDAGNQSLKLPLVIGKYPLIPPLISRIVEDLSIARCGACKTKIISSKISEFSECILAQLQSPCSISAALISPDFDQLTARGHNYALLNKVKIPIAEAASKEGLMHIFIDSLGINGSRERLFDALEEANLVSAIGIVAQPDNGDSIAFAKTSICPFCGKELIKEIIFSNNLIFDSIFSEPLLTLVPKLKALRASAELELFIAILERAIKCGLQEQSLSAIPNSDAAQSIFSILSSFPIKSSEILYVFDDALEAVPGSLIPAVLMELKSLSEQGNTVLITSAREDAAKHLPSEQIFRIER